MNNLSDLRFKINTEIQQYMLDIANLKIQLLQLDKNDKEYIKIDRKIKELKAKFIKEFQILNREEINDYLKIKDIK